MRRAAALALILAFGAPTGATGETDVGTTDALRRAGLVPVRDVSPGLVLDIRYATRDNFTGRPLSGYCNPWALLRPDAARALGRVQRRLAADGDGLKVFDAYRPARGTRSMVRWAQRSGNEHLLNGYIARRSNHNRGSAVDLTLLKKGRAAGMGTAYDSFSPRAATRNAGGLVLRNRLRLARAMEAEGFRNYSREWWHFDFPPLSGAARLDVPLCTGR